MSVRGVVLSFLVVAPGLIRAQPVAVERGPHHTVFESYETNLVDSVEIVSTNSFTQIGSGLNFFDATTQAYQPSVGVFELLESGGATFRQGQFKLLIAANVNDANGTIQWFPDAGAEEKIVLQTVGIVMTEISSGDSVFIANTKDSQGLLTAPNEITWVNCFENLDADIRVTVNELGGGYQSDVILHEKLPTGEALGFNGEVRAEVFHQILSGPAPGLQAGTIQRSAQVADVDTQLRFGKMLIGPGTAFLVGSDRAPVRGAAGKPVRVAKEYFVDQETQLRFLVESIPMQAITDAEGTLRPNRGAMRISPDQKQRLQALRGKQTGRRRPIALNTRPITEKRKVAAIERREIPGRPGLLWDYTTMVDTTNLVLSGNSTFFVNTNTIVNLSGTTVIEPSCVIKIGTYNPTNNTPVINILGALDCQTRPYAPCVISSSEDRTIGETNTAKLASIATNAYGYFHLCFPASNTNAIQLHDIHSRYALNAFGFLGTNSVEAWNIQVTDAQGDVFEGAGNVVALRNVLVNRANNVVAPTANNTVVSGEHFTIHSASKTYSAGSLTGCSLNLTNSLVAVVTNSSSGGFTNTSGHILSSDTGIFQSVGSGYHYLADNSPYRNSGSTSISTRLSGEVFKYSTTYPPQILANNITVNTTLTPQAQRDLDIPDEGYHYAALDYAVGGIILTNSTTLTLTNGVAVATYSTTALTLNGSSKLISEGSPLNMNRLVRHNTIVEQPVDWGTVGATYQMLSTQTGVSQISLRFTEVAHMAYSASSSRTYFLNTSTDIPADLTVKDCQFYSSYFGVTQNASGSPAGNVVNNLFHRSQFGYTVNYPYNASLSMRNNLFRYGSSSLYAGGTLSGAANDNLYDNATAGLSGSFGNANNGYINTSQMSGATGSKTPSTGDYQSGTLGRWYYPTSGGNLSTLIDAGSQTVGSAGLYHYTDRTDQMKDSSTVDIGFHFVALDANGNPVDTDNDGFGPDYLEDRNGNGVVDSGESAWTYAINGGGGLVVYTPLQP